MAPPPLASSVTALPRLLLVRCDQDWSWTTVTQCPAPTVRPQQRIWRVIWTGDWLDYSLDYPQPHSTETRELHISPLSGLGLTDKGVQKLYMQWCQYHFILFLHILPLLLTKTPNTWTWHRAWTDVMLKLWILTVLTSPLTKLTAILAPVWILVQWHCVWIHLKAGDKSYPLNW